MDSINDPERQGLGSVNAKQQSSFETDIADTIPTQITHPSFTDDEDLPTNYKMMTLFVMTLIAFKSLVCCLFVILIEFNTNIYDIKNLLALAAIVLGSYTLASTSCRQGTQGIFPMAVWYGIDFFLNLALYYSVSYQKLTYETHAQFFFKEYRVAGLFIYLIVQSTFASVTTVLMIYFNFDNRWKRFLINLFGSILVGYAVVYPRGHLKNLIFLHLMNYVGAMIVSVSHIAQMAVLKEDTQNHPKNEFTLADCFFHANLLRFRSVIMTFKLIWRAISTMGGTKRI